MPVNGSPQESIPSNDRGLAYGDGVFETIRIHRHQPVLFKSHLERLYHGAERLQISLDRGLLNSEIETLATDFPVQGVLKIIVTRGSGGRGYMPTTGMETTRILSLHALPDYSDRQPQQGIAAFVCQQRLAVQPTLAGIKHLNRLEQVMASLEWPGPEFLEGLMLDTSDRVVEGTRSNIFWAQSGRLFTPSLSRCGVAGIMRNYLIQTFDNVTTTDVCTLAQLAEADEMFFCNSIFGVWPVSTLQNGDTHISFDPAKRHFTTQAADAFSSLLATT